MYHIIYYDGDVTNNTSDSAGLANICCDTGYFLPHIIQLKKIMKVRTSTGVDITADTSIEQF